MTGLLLGDHGQRRQLLGREAVGSEAAPSLFSVLADSWQAATVRMRGRDDGPDGGTWSQNT